jgi:uncharacterized phiE125 gp8 family phage protein
MPLELTSPPSIEPVSLAEAKAHLKIDTTDDDTLIERLIAAARTRAEWHTGRALITQGWTLWRDAWCDPLALPLPPLRAVASLKIYGCDDTEHVLDSADYTVDLAGGRIVLKDGIAPPADLRRINAVAVAFAAGYGDGADGVPAPLRSAILAIVTFLYEHRGEAPAELPQDALALLAPYRVLRV